ncbi:MAG: hypothetical protein MRZ42_02885 [Tenericutes bacterium]|nr:hypothetical protein [Mycoplasmatota bacterium]
MNQNEPLNNIQNNNQINNVVENNTITEPSNVENPNPTPIAEVKVEQPNMEPKTPNKNNKASTILLILLFIFFFALIMGMPYINNFINNLNKDKGISEIEQKAKQEEEKQKQAEKNNQPTTKPEEKLTTLTCTISTSTNPNYKLTQTQKFDYNKDNQIITSSNIYDYTFTTLDETYQSLKKKCDEDSLKYINNEGYTMSCNYSDNSIEISDTFELETFKTITDGTTVIEANTSYKQDINTVKSNLINQGYTCK